MPRSLHFLFAVSLFLLLDIQVVSGQPKCSIHHYTTIDGLSHHRVMSIMKDRDGFMWFGTWAGINRFDGHSFVTFKTRPGDNSPLKTNRVDLIVEDVNGFLWVKCYDERLYRFDKREEKFEEITSLIGDQTQGSLLVDRVLPLRKGGIVLVKKNNSILTMTVKDGMTRVAEFEVGKESRFKLSDGLITTVQEDLSENLWIGTTKGLTVLRKDANGSYTARQLNSVKGQNVTACVVDGAKMLVGTASGNIIVISNFKVSGAKQLAVGQVNAIQRSKAVNAYYCATQNGELISFRSDLSIIDKESFQNEPLLSLYEDSEMRVWMEPEKDGVILYQPLKRKFNHFKQINYSSVILAHPIYSVYEDKQKRVWVNMKGCGFGYYDPVANEVRYFYNAPGKTDHYFSNLVSSQFYDPNGVLWLGTDDGGVNKVVFHVNEFKTEELDKYSNRRPANNVRGIAVDSRNRLWVATKDGKLVITLNGRKLENIFASGGNTLSGPVYSILEDRKGNIWLGTKGKGLYKAQPMNDKRTQYSLTNYCHSNDPNSISHNAIYTIAEDHSGRIWVGTYGGGVNLLIDEGGKVRFAHSGNEFQNYPSEEFMRVRHLAFDKNGLLWVATTDGLLISDAPYKIHENSTFKIYRKIAGDIHSLGDNDIQFILKDRKEVMWLGTLAGGLNKAIGGRPLLALKFKNFSIKEGLPSDYLLSGVEDSNRNLWIGTQNGLSKFNLGTEKFSNLDATDGFPVVTFEETSVAKTKEDQIIFGTVTGLVSFYPVNLKSSKINAKMTLTSLQVNSEVVKSGEKNSPLTTSIDQSTEIVLPYDQDIFSISYAVLDYRSTGKESYAYRLVGFDSEWRNNGNERRATYTKVPPGKYTFEVKSLAYDIYTNTPQHTLLITILPPPWETWWAYLIYTFLAAAVLLLVWRVTFTMLKLREGIIVERKLTELKLNFFTNVSHELRTPLTLIVNPLEEIAKNEAMSVEDKRNIDIVRKNAGRMIRFVNQLLDLRKVQSGKATLKIKEINVNLFIERVSTYFFEELKRKNIGLEIHQNEKPIYIWIDPEKIEIILYNLLSNAIKVNREGYNMTISIEETDSEVIISVADQGTCVPQSQLNSIFGMYFEGDHTGENAAKGTGIGLALAKELVELHNGTIYARNNDLGGLTVVVRLKRGLELQQEKNVVVVDSSHAELETSIVGTSSARNTSHDTGVTKNIDRVLLVEDNEELRTFLYYQLSKIYEVETAADGVEGLEKAKKLLPHLIISDIMMPRMDGIQMLDQLKTNPLTSHIPIILLSAKFSIESQIQGLSYGADFYLPKPFNNDLLITSVENLIRQRKRIFEALTTHKKIDLEPSEITITSDNEKFLKSVIKAVEDHMQDAQFNIDTIANSINMGRTAFYDKFTSLTNMPPVEFVREIRLKRAKQFFDAGKRGITDVAYEVGFTNQKYFSTCFRQQFGTTPTEYIKSKA